jgi:hypothetical protein
MFRSDPGLFFVTTAKLKVGWETLMLRATAELLPHSTMQTKARSKVRSSKALMRIPHDCYIQLAVRQTAITRGGDNHYV